MSNNYDIRGYCGDTNRFNNRYNNKFNNSYPKMAPKENDYILMDRRSVISDDPNPDYIKIKKSDVWYLTSYSKH